MNDGARVCCYFVIACKFLLTWTLAKTIQTQRIFHALNNSNSDFLKIWSIVCLHIPKKKKLTHIFRVKQSKPSLYVIITHSQPKSCNFFVVVIFFTKVLPKCTLIDTNYMRCAVLLSLVRWARENSISIYKILIQKILR